MKTFMTGLALALSTFMASSAMAASYEQHREHQEQRYEQRDRDRDHRYDDRRYNQRYQWNRANPSRDWRVGQVFPRYFEQSRYSVNYRDHRRLTRPGRYQQWYRINGDYVLVNERTRRIIRIID